MSKDKTATAMSEALTTALGTTEPSIIETTAAQAEVIAAPKASLVNPFASDDDNDDDAPKATTGLTVEQLFPLDALSFKAADAEVFKSEDGKRFSRTVGHVAIEIAGSGFYVQGTIREVQMLRDPAAHLEFAFSGSRRGQAINAGGSATQKAKLNDHKDKIVEAWQEYAKAIGLVPGSPVAVVHKHVLPGVSLIS
jgi:hypothetical protein